MILEKRNGRDGDLRRLHEGGILPRNILKFYVDLVLKMNIELVTRESGSYLRKPSPTWSVGIYFEGRLIFLVLCHFFHSYYV